MDDANAIILKKLIQSNSYLYQSSHQTDDYQLDYSRFWISYQEFLSLQDKFPFFTNPLLSGLLFSKHKKANKKQWFKSRFYTLYKDHLTSYSNKDFKTPKKVLLLKGVRVRLLSDVLNETMLESLTNEGILEKKSFIISRLNHFEIFFAGTNEMHNAWFKNLRKCCILYNFKSKYTLLNMIGRGSTCWIYQAVANETKRRFAVKIFDKIKIVLSFPNMSPTNNNNKVFLSIENEINVLRMLDHDYLIHLEEVYEEREHIILVFEELNGGDLFEKLKQRTFLEDEIKIVMKQLIEGISHFHEKNIMHRDIKPDNIFFVHNSGLALKLGDFGLAEYEKKKFYLSTRCGTPGYVAPEILMKIKYDTKCDIFSLGVLLYIMITNTPLFPGINENEVLKKNKIAKEVIAKINYSLLKASPECIDLLKNLLNTSPNNRFTSKQILSHDWFKNPNIMAPNSNLCNLTRNPKIKKNKQSNTEYSPPHILKHPLEEKEINSLYKFPFINNIKSEEEIQNEPIKIEKMKEKLCYIIPSKVPMEEEKK